MDTTSLRPYSGDAMNERTALRETLDVASVSIRALTREAGVSPRLLTLIRDGGRRLRETRDALTDVLLARADRCRRAAEALEAVEPRPRSDR